MDNSVRAKLQGESRLRLAWVGQALPTFFVLWLVLDGTHSWVLGVFVSISGALIVGWLAEGPPPVLSPSGLAGFITFFLVESLRGGFDVAWRTLNPRLPIEPRFFELKVGLPRGPATTLLISTISLLPGTLSAELKRDEHVLVIHALTHEGRESVERLQRRIGRLFGGGSASVRRSSREEESADV